MRHKKSFIVDEYMEECRECTSCSLRKHCRQVVPGSGSLPADILFLGIAPGQSEDILGECFVGPSGKILDYMIEDAMDLINLYKEIKVFKCNTVMCRSFITDRNNDKFNRNTDPSPEQVLTCKPKVLKLIKLINPTLIVFLGRHPEKYYKRDFPGAETLQHPSYLLQTDGIHSPYYKQNRRRLSEILEYFK